jgi:hypothetical protein
MGSNDWSYCSDGIVCSNGSADPWSMVMLVLAAMLISGFLFWAAFFTDDVDDDDGPDGGLMQPVYNPN